MAASMDNEVLEAFLVEAGELLDALGDQLIALEAEPRDGELLNSVFRTFHTLKGGAGFLAVHPMVELCHRAEELLNDARSQRLVLEPPHVDSLLQVLDVVLEMMEALREEREVPAAPAELMDTLQPSGPFDPPAEAVAAGTSHPGIDQDEFERLLDDLHGDGKAPGAKDASARDSIDDAEFEALLDDIYGKGGAPGVGDDRPANTGEGGATTSEESPNNVMPAKAGARVDSVAERTIDSGLRRNDEPKASPAVAPPHEEASAAAGPTKHRAETSVRIDTQRIDALVNAAGELVLVRNRLVNLTSRNASDELERAVHNLDRVAGDLQAAALRMRMQPIGKLFQRFPRMVRDLARKLGKQVTLEQRGEDTQLDRALVESLADPLVHLLRNAVDHGLEDPDSRAQAGKSREGTVTLSAGQQGERILISIRDDGRGMDPEVLRRKAVEKGLLDAAQADRLEPAECLALIFRPGFSTRGEISDISGRGVGMDVVKTSVAALGGTIEIESTPGTGTTIHIAIPLTLAIMRILMVRVGDRRLALPLANVLEVFELDRTQMRMLDGRVVAAHRGRPLPLSDLASWAGVAAAQDARVHVVVVHVGHQQLGLLAGEVLGREDVTVKPLGAHLRDLPGIAGATITGDGRVALVLDLVALAESSLPQPLRMTA
ncbi:MAG TPA: chemotaxis protein CheA [Rhodanobacteraceae bacterium]|nr:chemotaxis protein CheA [Rhodanobacteraceae bacterium]